MVPHTFPHSRDIEAIVESNISAPTHADFVEMAKVARALTPEEQATNREALREHDAREPFSPSMTEAYRFGEERAALGRPVTPNPYCSGTFPLHYERFCDGWQDEVQRRMTETDR